MDTLFHIYKWFSNYVSVIPLLIGFVKFKRLNKAFLYLMAMVVSETAIAFYSRWQAIHGIYNTPSLHLLTFLEILFGAPFFYFILDKKYLKAIVLGSSIIFLFYTSCNSLFLQDLYDYNHVARVMEGYLFVLYSFFYFYELITRPQVIELSKSSTFWIVIGFFTYFGTTQFIHLFSDIMRSYHHDAYKLMREINRAMVVIYYLIFAIGLWKKK